MHKRFFIAITVLSNHLQKKKHLKQGVFSFNESQNTPSIILFFLSFHECCQANLILILTTLKFLVITNLNNKKLCDLKAN